MSKGEFYQNLLSGCKSLASCLILTASLLASFPTLAAFSLSTEERQYLNNKQQLTTCVDPDWMPLESIQNGTYLGMGADYLAVFSKIIDIPIKVHITKTWKESKDKARSRECDILMLSSNSESRREFMDLSEPYLRLPLVIAALNSESFIPNQSHLQGKAIGIVDSYALKQVLKKQYPKINFVGVKSRNFGLQQVVNKSLFGFVDTVTALTYSIQQDHPDDLKIIAKLSVNWELSVATRKDEPLLKGIFNKAVLEIGEDQHSIIFQRGVAATSKVMMDYSLIWKTAIVFSFVILFFIYRNKELKRYHVMLEINNEQLANLNAELKDKQDEISHLAYNDHLTGLPNKKTLSQKLSHAIKIANRKQNQLAVLFIDLDHFKMINDSLGHSVGDTFLKAISNNLSETLRDADVFARVGGDEFVVVLENIKNKDEAKVVADKILKTASTEVSIKDYYLSSSASIGIAFYPLDGSDSETLLKNADSAMYAAKGDGKNCYHFYTDALLNNILRRLFIEKAIPIALEKNQFCLVYQPKLNLADNKIMGAEVLIRWIHPDEGFISPLEFIAIAEESGLIVEIGNWVFDQACLNLKKWMEASHSISNLSINVSSIQINRTDIVSSFSQIVKSHDLHPSHIEIEITEHSLMENTKKNLEHLNQLRDKGFKISIDDFGTGYSSMSYLRSMPVDTIKIDKSFIDDLPDDQSAAQITNAIISLAHSLNFNVVAEGIESYEQQELLRTQGCDITQGYYFSKPLNESDLLSLINNHLES